MPLPAAAHAPKVHVPLTPPSLLTAQQSRDLVKLLSDNDSNPLTNETALTFAPTTNNQIETLVDGAEFFPKLIEDLRSAKHSIHIVQYGFKPGKLGDEIAAILADKARAGVKVRVIVSAFGSNVGMDPKNMYAKMVQAGVEIVTRNSIFPLTRKGLLGYRRRLVIDPIVMGAHEHRKIIVVDGQAAYTGGMGFEDHFVDKMHDFMLRLKGPVVHQLQTLFFTTFMSLLEKPLGLTATELNAYYPPPPPVTNKTLGPMQLFNNEPAAKHMPILGEFLRDIQTAQRSLVIMNPYVGFPPVTYAICDTAKRGVDVTLILPARTEGAFPRGLQHYFYDELLAAGVKIYEYPTLLHGKASVKDGKSVLIGSANLNSLSLKRNYELQMRIDDPFQAARYLEIFGRDIKKCKAIVEPEKRHAVRAWNVFCHKFDQTFF
jgi:cardiolipin synthase